MKRCTWVGLLLLAIAAAAPATASTFVAMSHEQLVAASAAVVQGRVIKTDSFWTPSGRLIVTEAMVQVEEVIVGAAPSVAVVRTAGGKVQGFTVEAHGFPQFEVGQRVVLFLQAGDPAQVTGYRLGHYRIAADGRGNEVAVPTLERGVQLLTADGSPAPRPRVMRLDTLKDQVRAHAARIVR
ncbi:MAG TPA: hypothetical protein VF121_06955 [Thermoanaerobaculia bacterium]|nr:hypothetical protein [Thermoanaerobaculia bacterium]